MDEIAAYFNKRAGKWDENGCSGESRVQGAVLSLVDLKPGDSVLDLGCGTGVMIPFYLAAQAGKIVAVDVSEKMVERAKEKFGNEGPRRMDEAGLVDGCVVKVTGKVHLAEAVSALLE